MRNIDYQSRKIKQNRHFVGKISIPGKEFLDRFPHPKRTLPSQRFLAEIRAGIRNPDDVVRAVLDRADFRQSENDQLVAQTVRAFPDEARRFALFYLARESLPPHIRESEKESRAEIHRRSYMAAKPPTPKQLAYLSALGFTGSPPENRCIASDLIERMRGGKDER